MRNGRERRGRPNARWREWGGGLLALALASVLGSAACSSNSAPNPGTGGSHDAGDGGLGGAAGAAVDASGTDVAAGDAAADTHGDAGTDTRGTGPCTTSFGAANPVKFAFNGGANDGWTHFISSDLAMSGLTSSIGASFTEGHSCPGSLVLAGNFTAYGPSTMHGESVSTEFFYGSSPNGADWSAYKALHAWIKVQTPDVLGLDGVFFYVKSGGNTKYESDFGASADLTDWHEVIVDLTATGVGFAGVIPNDVQSVGFELELNMSPPTGAPATPSQAILFIDDIWLEARPASDAGVDAAADSAVDTAADGA